MGNSCEHPATGGKSLLQLQKTLFCIQKAYIGDVRILRMTVSFVSVREIKTDEGYTTYDLKLQAVFGDIRGDVRGPGYFHVLKRPEPD